VQKNTSLGSDISFLNDRLSTLKKSLEEAYSKANGLAKQEAEEGAFQAVLADVNRLKKKSSN